jgi:hypothetical protein
LFAPASSRAFRGRFSRIARDDRRLAALVIQTQIAVPGGTKPGEFNHKIRLISAAVESGERCAKAEQPALKPNGILAVRLPASIS